jgi:hypothetical protein
MGATVGATVEMFAVRLRPSPFRFSSQTFAPWKCVMPWTVSSTSPSTIRSLSVDET